MSAGVTLGVIKTEPREIVLGQTDGFRYIGVKPPLTNEEINGLPLPINFLGSVASFHDLYISRAIHKDGSMQLGFDSTIVFCEPENVYQEDAEASNFVRYARQVAVHLGNTSLDTTVRYLGPGSMFSPENMQ
jgi:hypothetical protein